LAMKSSKSATSTNAPDSAKRVALSTAFIWYLSVR
jgi:hypothetical protein